MMAGEDDKKKARREEKPDSELTREERLAKALRDNLRRRKAKKD